MLQLTKLQTRLVLSCVQELFPAFLYWNKERSQQMADQEGGGGNKEAIIREHHGKGEQHWELKDAT